MTENTLPPEASNQPISTKPDQTLPPTARNQEDSPESGAQETLIDVVGPPVAPYRRPLFGH